MVSKSKKAAGSVVTLRTVQGNVTWVSATEQSIVDALVANGATVVATGKPSKEFVAPPYDGYDLYDVCQVSSDNGTTWADYAAIKSLEDARYALSLCCGVPNSPEQADRLYRIVSASSRDVVLVAPSNATPAPSPTATEPSTTPATQTEEQTVPTVTSKPSNKPAAKGGKGTSSKPTSKPAAAPAKTKPDAGSKGGLSNNKVKVLTLLAKAKQPMTRSEMAEKTGIAKGWAKLLGAVTKGDAEAGTLEGDGLVRSEKVEGEAGLRYTITAAGRKLLDK